MDVELFVVLGFHTEWIGSPLPTFQRNLSIPPAMVFLHCVTLQFRTDICLETSVTNYRSTLHNVPEERRCILQRRGRLNSRLGVLFKNS